MSNNYKKVQNQKIVQKMEQDKKLPSTISRNIASLRAFYKYLNGEDLVKGNPTLGLQAPKIERKTPAILSSSQVELLLQQPKTSELKGLRDKYEEHHEDEQASVQEENNEPEIQYIYNNGSYTASAYGYDGDVTVTVTIENDVIVSITGYTNEIDSNYFEDAKDYVFSQIISSGSTGVSAYAGSTYSSNAIMSAVAQALESAKR